MKQLWYGLTGWGYWPVLVMVSAQLAINQGLARDYPPGFFYLTVTGTLAMYGLDRFVERRSVTALAARHQSVQGLDLLTLGLIGVFGLAGLFTLTLGLLVWAAILTAGGVLYLLTTTARIPLPAGCKEALGALLFTILIWGPFPPTAPLVLGSIFLLGLANFAWSSFQDQDRDQTNGIPNLYLAYPAAALPIARLCTGLALAVLLVSQGPRQELVWVAAAHLCWPSRLKPSIDWAFLPLLIALFRIFNLVAG